MSKEIVQQCSPACDSQDVPPMNVQRDVAAVASHLLSDTVKYTPVALYALYKTIERLRDDLPDTEEYRIIKTDLLLAKGQLILASNRIERLIDEAAA